MWRYATAVLYTQEMKKRFYSYETASFEIEYNKLFELTRSLKFEKFYAWGDPVQYMCSHRLTFKPQNLPGKHP